MSKELKYKMKVRINQGFYEGVEGTLLGRDEDDYSVNIGDGVIFVEEDEIELI